MGNGISSDTKKNKVQYYRSKTVALYALFGVSKVDSASLTSVLEKVDSTYTNTIDIRKFAYLYCGVYQECILFLWMKFNGSVFKVAGIEELEKEVETDDSVSGSPTNKTLDDETKSNVSSLRDKRQASSSADEMFVTSYHKFLYFLLLLMSRDDKEIVQYLWWVRFHLSKTHPKHNDLYSLIDSVWGRQEKVKFKRNKKKKYVETLLGDVEESDFCPKSIQNYDLRSGGAWSAPIRKMRNQIAKKTLGNAIWKRINERVVEACINLPEAYAGLKDNHDFSKKKDLLLADQPQLVLVLHGDRRDARKELRVIVRSYKTYTRMPLDTQDDDIDTSMGPGGGMFALFECIGTLVVMGVRKIIPAKPKVEPDDEEERYSDDDQRDRQLDDDGSDRDGDDANNVQKTAGNSMEGLSATKRNEMSKSMKGTGMLSTLFGGGSNRRTYDYLQEEEKEKEVSIVPLEIVYQQSLTAPLGDLYSRSATTKDTVGNMLEICKSAFEPLEGRRKRLDIEVEESGDSGKYGSSMYDSDNEVEEENRSEEWDGGEDEEEEDEDEDDDEDEDEDEDETERPSELEGHSTKDSTKDSTKES